MVVSIWFSIKWFAPFNSIRIRFYSGILFLTHYHTPRLSLCTHYGNNHLYLNEISSNKTKIYEFSKREREKKNIGKVSVSYTERFHQHIIIVAASLAFNTSNPIQFVCNVFMIGVQSERRQKKMVARVWVGLTICYLCENLDTAWRSVAKWRTQR